MALSVPAIHINGTDRETLVEGYLDATRTLRSAIRALREAAPNGRDYYHLNEVDKAMREHKDRLQRLESVLNELNQIAEVIA